MFTLVDVGETTPNRKRMCEIHTTLCKSYGHVSGCLITKGKGTPKSKKMKGIHMLALSEYTITYAQSFRFKGAR